MNKNIIKKFAIWARKELIMSVTRIASYYDIEPNNIKEDVDITTHGDILSFREKSQRKGLIEKIKSDGFDETMEEIAYTWFNRFIAIRFMEVNGYLPSHVRMFSDEDGNFNPEILSECLSVEIEGLDKEKVFELYDKSNKEELFHYLIITQCNELSNLLPGIFEKISDYTELLLPNNLLKEGSVIKAMVEDIPEEDWKEQVQIIGWLYQYYNTELKDKVISEAKAKRIPREEIPAATQLFTPEWIVKYMVENSLGRLWIEGHPNTDLNNNWKYYIEEVEQDTEIQLKIDIIKKEHSKLEPMDIKCIDPAMGSGHILCYLFDVLIQIYESYGYKSRDAVRMIIENNLYGLDVDERARQLSYFSVMMKARQYDRRFFNREVIPQPFIYTINQSNLFTMDIYADYLDYFINGDKELNDDIHSIINDMLDAKEYGSIIKINPVNFKKIYSRFNDDLKNSNIYNLFLFEHLLPLVKQAEILCQKYDVVVTNPPYMGSGTMNKKLSSYINKNYKDSKSDLFAVFIERCKDYTKENGYQAMITQHTWMFLPSYENLRNKLHNISIINMAHLGSRAFEDISGEIVQTTAFIMRNTVVNSYKGTYEKLIDVETSKAKEKLFLSKKNKYIVDQKEFSNIPGYRIVYWASKQVINIFKNSNTMENILDVRQGLATGNNDYFLKMWYEVDLNRCKFDSRNSSDFLNSNKKWLPYNKAGQRRKWYGNYNYLVNWENDGYAIKHFFNSKGKLRSRPQNQKYYFKEAITWNLMKAGGFSVRYRTSGGIHDVNGMSAFAKDYSSLFYILGLMNTKLGIYIFNMINATTSLQIGDFKIFPVVTTTSEIKLKVKDIVEENIKLSQLDWDMHETSWDFEESPLLKNKVDGLLASAYEAYKEEVNERFEILKQNEEELNRIFINLYGLQEELQPEVEDKDITVAKIFDSKDDIDVSIKGNRYVLTREDVVKNFLSYFIGCCMGRYSLDAKGIAYAGGEFDSHKYQTFKADNDGIIPLTEKEFFEDDIIVRLEEFLTVTFGEETLNENLDFIACELKGKASLSSRDKIRNYFMKDFYKDHCKMYQKCPIYWQADSGKLGASRNLIYMHRYQKDTIASLRIRYVFEIQDRYNQELEHLEQLIDNTTSGSDRVKYQKQADKIKKLIIETQNYEEKVQHIADSYIEIDLDNGVKENYKLFEDIFSKIK